MELTGGGADYSIRMHRQRTTTMRQALECCHKGWGESVIIGVAGAGRGNFDPAVSAGDRPRLEVAPPFGGAKGRTDVPQIVDWYMDGKINIDDLITHTMPLDKINDAFHLMHEGTSIRSVITY